MTSFFGSDVGACLIELCPVHADPAKRSLRASILSALGGGRRRVVIDCVGWERLDLLVLSALVQGAKACQGFGATFELINLAPTVRDDIVALRLEHRLGLVA